MYYIVRWGRLVNSGHWLICGWTNQILVPQIMQLSSLTGSYQLANADLQPVTGVWSVQLVPIPFDGHNWIVKTLATALGCERFLWDSKVIDLKLRHNSWSNSFMTDTLQWRHNEHDGVSNHQPRDCLLKCLFRRRSKKTSKLCVTGLREGNSPVPGEFPAQRGSNAENLWWHHHDFSFRQCIVTYSLVFSIQYGTRKILGHFSHMQRTRSSGSFAGKACKLKTQCVLYCAN